MATQPPGAAPAPPSTVLLETNPAPILLVDGDGLVRWANHGPHGEPPSALVGHPLALPEAERARAILARVARGSAESFEVAERGPAGTSTCLRVDASPAGEGQTLLVIADVTAHKQEEERLRRSESLLIDAQGVAHMGTWDWDISQPHASWSDELYRIYGLTPQEYTPSYEAYLNMVHPDDRDRVMRATEGVFKEHVPYSHDERIYRKDGELRWLHTWAIPVLDEQGKLTRLLGVCQDVTENKRAEGAMRAQMLTRGLARRLLHDLIRRAHVSEHVVRELGRGLAREPFEGEKTPEGFAAAFADMGFGALRFEGEQNGRYTFRALDLLERKSESNLPTCFMTLGYLEGVVSELTGRAALGSEMRCQSMGHEECRFVVQ